MKNYIELYRAKAQAKTNTIEDSILLCAYKALNAKSDGDKSDIFAALLTRAFSPITNATKLANGRRPYDSLESRLSGYNSYQLKTAAATIAETPQELEAFNNLFKEMASRFQTSEPFSQQKYYSFIFVDPKLSASQRIVQSSHAAIELGHAMARENISAEELHLVVCSMKDEESLIETLRQNSVTSISYREADMDNQLTAIATYPIADKKRAFLQKYQLI